MNVVNNFITCEWTISKASPVIKSISLKVSVKSTVGLGLSRLMWLNIYLEVKNPDNLKRH